ncbi:MAG: tyrosine-type recombinase/integrase [Nitrosomonadales bacterium]|nr:tyrosine-type recombinase/integrase [Nitrosomonadales bacterium]
MGRRPTTNTNLPPRMRARAKAGGRLWYYYDAGGKPRREIPLGSDYTEAVRRWAALEQNKTEAAQQLITLKAVADRYLREIIPTKAARTQKDNITELAQLLKFFNDPPAPLEAIKPLHVRQYLDWRGKEAKTRANREKALLSHIWNKAREWGLTDLPNPCAGVKGFRETGRDIYIEDEVMEAVWQAAEQPLRDSIDLAYLTGQRPADTLSMSLLDISDGALHVQQGKTGQKLRIAIEGELAELIERIRDGKRGCRVHSLRLVCSNSGVPLSPRALRSGFDRARERAAINTPSLAEAIRAFQFRDLRAKAGTDKADSEDIRAAQLQLGHKNITMTEHYVRARRGQKVSPTR